MSRQLSNPCGEKASFPKVGPGTDSQCVTNPSLDYSLQQGSDCPGSYAHHRSISLWERGWIILQRKIQMLFKKFMPKGRMGRQVEMTDGNYIPSNALLFSSFQQLTSWQSLLYKLSLLIALSSFQSTQARVHVPSLSLWVQYRYVHSPGEEKKAKEWLTRMSQWDTNCPTLSCSLRFHLFVQSSLIHGHPCGQKPWFPHLCVQPLILSSPLLPRCTTSKQKHGRGGSCSHQHRQQDPDVWQGGWRLKVWRRPYGFGKGP